MTKLSIFKIRQEKLVSELGCRSIGALILNPGSSLTYLTGLHFHLMERPILAIFTKMYSPVFILPELEAAKLSSLPFPSTPFLYSEDPTTWQSIFSLAVKGVLTPDLQIAVEPTQMRVLELEFLRNATQSSQIISDSDIIASLRMVKDSTEIMAMRRAVDIAQTALNNILLTIRSGITERQLASLLVLELIKAGSDPLFPFSPIVSGGTNSANPHATPTDRPFQNGDLLVIDWGAKHNGYISDITRTFAIRTIDKELKRIAEIVHQANSAGRRVIKPGVKASTVDKAARKIIQNAGYGEYFIHRTGHGIGMEGHEAPYIRQDNNQQLEAGMTFTVEPGIYIPDRGGVRIEDDVIVTESGAESLSNLPRELIIL